MPDIPAPLSDLLRDRYAFERELGRGGMAVVYLAEDLKHRRRVAVKVLRPELANALGPERFLREIEVLARLRHPNILPLYDSGDAGGFLFYVMPWVDGESLRARLDREAQLPLDAALGIAAEVADALAYAHRNGVVHRDIKPENILLESGHAMVADFGIARAVSEAGGERLTETGLALGTPLYMSPEQSAGTRDLDGRSDVYSLGCVLYEMLAGEPPFTGPTAQSVVQQHVIAEARPVTQLRPAVPAAAAATVARALAKAPADRWQTAEELHQRLRALGRDPGEATVALARPPARRRWGLVAGVGLVGLAAAAAVGYRIASGRTAGSPAAPVPAAAAAGGIRLAVLPFRLIGSDSADRYLAEGITEDINSALSNLTGLRVVAQSSVGPAAAAAKRVREIGEALRVDALVQGDVQRAGATVRVRVSLIDPATEESRWSQEFDHTTDDVFRIQSEVALRVAGLLRIQLAERESRTLGRLPTTNPAAYDRYLRARARVARGNPRLAAQDSGIAELSDAVALDPAFAAAWSLRAATLISSVFLFGADPSRLNQAESDIRRALAVDSALAGAWSARSSLEWNAVRGWHFPEALADARHAAALEPSSVRAHNTLGSLYFHYGFLEDARRELAVSLSLDPRDGCDDPTVCTGFSHPRIARILWYGQRFDSALAVYRAMPFVGGFIWEYAVVLNGADRPAEGLALLDSARARAPRENADRLAARGLVLASLGRGPEALEAIRAAAARMVSRSHFHHAQFTIASAFARLGRKAEAVEWLRRAAANGMPNYPLFRNDPNLRGLQGDSAYEAMMAGMRREFERYGTMVRAGGPGR